MQSYLLASNGSHFLDKSLCIFADIDPESSTFSANMSGMIVSSDDDISDDEDEVAVSTTRKHIVYQSNLFQLVKMVCLYYLL